MYILLKYMLLPLFLCLPVISYAQDNVPFNTLTVKFDLENHTLRGISRISLAAGHAVRVNLSGLKILSVLFKEKPVDTEPDTAWITFQPENTNEVLEIVYEAEFKPLADADVSKNQDVVWSNFIGRQGIILADEWYPSVDGLSLHNLTVTLPKEFEGISEAEEIIIKERTDNNREFTYIFPHPLSNINFVAGKYLIEKDKYNETEIFAYFLPEDTELSKTYIEYTKKYLNMYERLIGRYPFKRFSIVENLLPTGYAMPTLTLLGQEVVRLPFIVETSLGHEILHQWFGNLVYTDHKNGNWSEGLTTYLADHMYEDKKGSGWDYRKQLLITFQSYVTPENDFPVKSFTSRYDRTSGAIGYGKSAMTFHMLKNIVGEDIFFKSLRIFIERNKFSPASWIDIRESFEFAYGESLDWFFEQWVDGKGIPEIEVKNVELKYRGSNAIVSFEILQQGQNYNLYLPVLLKLKEGEIRKTFELKNELTSLKIETEGAPVELIIDDNYDLFRKLSYRELPPVISRLLGDHNRIFVIPKGESEEYAIVSDFLRNEGFIIKNEEEIGYGDIKTSSLIIPGTVSGLAKKLFGKIEKKKEDFHVVTRENPFNKKGMITIIDAASLSELSRYIPKIRRYGKYSHISFKDGKNTLKTITRSEKGIRQELTEEIMGIELPNVINFYDIIEKVSNKLIIYVGESHDSFEHHRVQLEVARELHKRNKDIAIGMEMFQKPFQKVIDNFINGIIDEKEFLKKTEYFKRWGLDYNLYREILLFAREYRIPVIGLNIDREIVSKVSEKGLRALTEEELREVPEYIDLSDSKYRERLRGFFEKHANSEDRNFDFFYQAQVLWDESMAHNLDEFMKQNPGYQVIVIAGAGHMAFGSGIPKRAYRLNSKDYSVILNDADIEQNIADFILFPAPVKPPESPKLMVMLKEEGGKVKISSFAPESISKKAGLKKGDILLSLDGTKIKGVDDIKIFLLDKKKGDEVAVKILRKRFIFGTVEKKFDITF